MRVTPVESSQSHGPIEGFHQTVFGQFRTLRMAVVDRLKVRLEDMPVDHPFTPWLVKHVAWLINRLLIHDDGLTSYQRRFKQDSTLSLIEFGEMVHFRPQGVHAPKKSDPQHQL